MKIRVWFDQSIAQHHHESEIVEWIGSKLNRFAGRISRVEVTVRDVNGDKGGVDKLGRLTAHLLGGYSITVSEQAQLLSHAIGKAAERLQYSLAKTLEKRAKLRSRESASGVTTRSKEFDSAE
jgi:ribosome-associated translation inhibitor RaiA